MEVFTKKRRDFGAPVNFSYTEPYLIDSLAPNPELHKLWVERTHRDQQFQTSREMSEHEVNTDRIETISRGIYHKEGGWPKEIDPTESEHVTRYRKKIERDRMYAAALRTLQTTCETIIKQNNAVEINEKYFDSAEESEVQSDESDVPTLKSLTVLRDPNGSPEDHDGRWARKVVWRHEGAQKSRKVAISYCSLDFDKRLSVDIGGYGSHNCSSYIWDITNPNFPEQELSATAPITCLEYHTKDTNLMLGGWYNGMLSLWDTRKGHRPVDTTDIKMSHSDAVLDLKWIKSKSGMECASVGADGRVLWWDVRKFSSPIDTMEVRLPAWALAGRNRPGAKRSSRGSARPGARGAAGTTAAEEKPVAPLLGTMCIDYDSAAGLNKFTIGTETGHICLCNSKGRTPSERISAVFHGQHGAISSLYRSPFYPKFFLTSGDWSVRLFHEEVGTPILASKYAESRVVDCNWSPVRPGVFASAQANGYVDIWDLVRRTTHSVLSTKVSEHALTCCSFDHSGNLLAVGDEKGGLTICEVSKSLSNIGSNEKHAVQSVLDREQKREKNLESRMKESRLGKTTAKVEDSVVADLAKEEEEVERLFLESIVGAHGSL
ncbi:Dynein axonemal intermediate chain 2 [Aduncisulcus paluster]|uniref:Dynein axonemal intermediate chain 2 n=1 Tax=Aduncisulcus paluster TaxID=2918883 RepID=A0ABQ5JSJ9_9EUKA|nr:Dynein axonemal intermediate chain 2 [Aduncisulcus paluster]